MTKQEDNNRQTEEQTNQQKNQQKNTLKVDPATTVLIILALLFIPLVLAGFFSQ